MYEHNAETRGLIDELPFEGNYFTDEHKLYLYIERRIEIAYGKKECKKVHADDATKLRKESRIIRRWLKGFAITILVLSSLLLLCAIIFYVTKKRFENKNPVKFMYICFFFTICILLSGAIIFWSEEHG